MRLAIILLRQHQLPKAESLLEALAAIAPAVAPGVRALPPTDGSGVVLEVAGLGEVFVSLISSAVPDGEAEANAPLSVSALGTGWQLGSHSSHAVVAFKERGELSLLERLRLFTFLLAAVVETTDCAGVYWGAARATHEPRFFTRVARALDVLPTMLWTGVVATPSGSDRVGLLSTGMHQLGLPELLLTVPNHVPNGSADPLDFFFDLLSSCALRGRAPQPDDTVSRTPQEKLPIRFVTSPLDPSQQVWTVSLPSA